MKIVGMEKFSLVDFDTHVSCTIFTLGCNFKCPFCHNSSLALGTNPTLISEEEVLDYLRLRKNMLDALVITGGEPTLQHDLKDFLKKVREIGLKIKLDSNGSNPKILKDLIDSKLVDYIAMDIKNNPIKYSDITDCNVDMDSIYESIDILKNSDIDYEFRTTLVEEYHTKDDIEAIGKLIKGAKRYYFQKFVGNENCINQNLHEIKKDRVLEFVEILKPYLDVKLRGY